VKKIYGDMDFLQAIGILIVVWAHLHDRTAGPHAWTVIRDFISPIPMPIFFMCSGYFFHERNKISVPFLSHMKHVIPRYVIPFVSFSLITALYKILIQNVFGYSYIKHPFTVEAIISHLLNPQGGFATYLWFLYVLLLVQLLYPLLKRTLKYDLLLLVAFIALNALEMPKLFCLNLVVGEMPYFLVGILLSTVHYRELISVKLSFLLGSILLLIFFSVRSFFNDLFFSIGLMYTSLPIFLWLVSFHLIRLRPLEKLSYLGRRSLDLYLWHTLIIGVVKVVLIKTLNPSFWILTVTCFILTCFSCILLTGIIDALPRIKYLLYGRN
jgi:fucose 4-O-acetylase-like acetyltransferase